MNLVGQSLDAAYFDRIFESDADPWNLSTSPYEAEKFDQTIAALADRRYRHALEVGCAQGVLTARLASLCDRLLAIDISSKALALARSRVGDRPGVTLQQMAFPRETPSEADFDLAILSEVAYYWNAVDLERAAEWLAQAIVPGGRLLLVHWTGATDYPHSGDEAVESLRASTGQSFHGIRSDRTESYRLDLWERA